MAMKTPGVYVIEKNAFPSSVVEVATAIPAFIGYTEKAGNGSLDLTNKPRRITSMAEYHSYFGGAPQPEFSFNVKKENVVTALLTENINEAEIQAKEKVIMASTKEEKAALEYSVTYDRTYTFYYNLLFFFANGGGSCYIVSVGNYNVKPDKKQILNGIDTLLKEQEPTMLVIPEAVNFSEKSDCKEIQEAMLKHCGYQMKNRIAILDIYSGDKEKSYREGVFKDKDVITSFRDDIGANFLNYGTAYYPWLNTSIISENDITFEYFSKEDSRATLVSFLTEKLIEPLDQLLGNEKDGKEQLRIGNRKKELEILIKNLGSSETDIQDRKSIHETLRNICPEYRELIKDMAQQINVLPPSAAMAGIYTMIDNTRGVWKAPANVSVANAIGPTVNITHEEQEDLNVPLSGKAINAIRTFTGEGIKVWGGARTLDGNSLDWRYINVRRTMIMLEESIKNAARIYVFDPNVANTWISVKSMIGNFLNGIWKRGGLAGAAPDDAYSVHLGLGETMTPEDVLEGIMRITVLVAISRPAEFIEITFQQQMQKS